MMRLRLALGLGVGLLVGVAPLVTFLVTSASAGRREAVEGRDTGKGFTAASPEAVVGPPLGGTAPASNTPAVEAISPADGKRALGEFLHAQTSELKALSHRQSMEVKELKASQAARQSEWSNRENEARRRYFAEHKRGPERRKYVGEFMQRRKAFDQSLAEDLANRRREHEARAAAMRSEQGEKLKEFKESIDKGEKPAARLWPGAS